MAKWGICAHKAIFICCSICVLRSRQQPETSRGVGRRGAAHSRWSRSVTPVMWRQQLSSCDNRFRQAFRTRRQSILAFRTSWAWLDKPHSQPTFAKNRRKIRQKLQSKILKINDLLCLTIRGPGNVGALYPACVAESSCAASGPCPYFSPR